MKYILVGLLLISCNVLKTLTDGETDPGNDFYQNNYCDDSDTSGGTNSCDCDTSHFNSSCFYETLYDNVLFFFKMEEGSGSRVDSINNLSLAENYTVGSTTGTVGQAINCNSASPAGHVLSGSYNLNLGTGDDFSIAFWANKTENSSGGCADYEYVVSFNNSSYVMFDDIDCSGGGDNSDLEFKFNGNTYQFLDVANFPGYHHFVLNVTTGGDMVELYVNGSYFGQDTDTGVPLSTSDLEVCSDSGGGSKLVGSIDSLGMWNRLLSNNEIERLANGQNTLE